MEEVLQLSHKQFLKLDKDYEKAASAAALVYVNDRQKVIAKLRKGKGFTGVNITVKEFRLGEFLFPFMK